MRRRASVPVFLAGMALVGACGDAGPVSGPGTLTATVVSPNGAEGAAVVEVFGPGIGEVSALGGDLFSERRGDTVRVVLIRAEDGGGDLAFRFAVADTTQAFVWTIFEVAGPDDELRNAAVYSLEVRK